MTSHKSTVFEQPFSFLTETQTLPPFICPLCKTHSPTISKIFIDIQTNIPCISYKCKCSKNPQKETQIVSLPHLLLFLNEIKPKCFQHPEMESFFFDEAEYITFVCPEAIIGKVIATFGKNVRISKIPALDNEGMKKDIVWLRGNLKEHYIKVTVKTTSYAARQFVRKNAPYTMVLAPEKLKKSILREQYNQHEFSMMIEDKIKKAEEKR